MIFKINEFQTFSQEITSGPYQRETVYKLVIKSPPMHPRPWIYSNLWSGWRNCDELKHEFFDSKLNCQTALQNITYWSFQCISITSHAVQESFHVFQWSMFEWGLLFFCYIDTKFTVGKILFNSTNTYTMFDTCLFYVLYRFYILLIYILNELRAYMVILETSNIVIH